MQPIGVVTMKYYYLKRKHPIDENTPLYIHFGIPRTGSSTVRHLIRRYCNLLGYSWRGFDVKLPIDQQRQLIADSHYLFLEEPFIAHTLTQRPCYYLTTVREPIEQLISLYSWHINKGHTELPVDRYVEQLPESLNCHCRWLSLLQEKVIFDDMKLQHLLPEDMFGEQPFYYPISDDDLFARAKSVIDHQIEIASTLDQLPAFIFELGELANWPLLPFNLRINYSVKHAPFQRDMLSSEMLDKLRSCTAADEKLFAYVKEKFDPVEQAILQQCGDDYKAYKENAALMEKISLISNGHSLVGQTVVSSGVGPESINQIDISNLETAKYIFHGEDHIELLESL